MSEVQRITREVIMLSGLNHANVVGYYQAWLEPADGAPFECWFCNSVQLQAKKHTHKKRKKPIVILIHISPSFFSLCYFKFIPLPLQWTILRLMTQVC